MGHDEVPLIFELTLQTLKRPGISSALVSMPKQICQWRNLTCPERSQNEAWWKVVFVCEKQNKTERRFNRTAHEWSLCVLPEIWVTAKHLRATDYAPKYVMANLPPLCSLTGCHIFSPHDIAVGFMFLYLLLFFCKWWVGVKVHNLMLCKFVEVGSNPARTGCRGSLKHRSFTLCWWCYETVWLRSCI